MLKTISAALLAVSVIAAPALAAETAKDSGKAVQAPAAKTVQAPANKTSDTKAADIKPVQTKPSAMNAKAEMSHHAKHHRHHRSHKKMSSLKTHKVSKASIKQVVPTTKRG
jgi:hypothetical protein